MKILMSVETKRSNLPEIRKFNSTVDALNYMVKKGYKMKHVTIETIKDGRVILENNTLSTLTMGYKF